MVIDEPYTFYRQLRDRAPVWTVPDRSLVAVSTYDLVAEATGRVEDFSSSICCLLYRDDAGLPCRLPLGDDTGMQALATADPPVHASHRKAVFPELVAKRMAALEPDVADVAAGCLAPALARGTVEFVTEIGNVVPITMISRLVGFHDSNPADLLSAAFDSTAMLSATLTYDELLACLTRTADIQTWLTEQLAIGLREPGDDLLGAAARGVTAGVFTEFQAVVTLHTLLSAGGESTTSLLGNAVRLLAERQDLQSHLRDNPAQIPTFIEEALRLEPPFRYHMRTVARDTTLGPVGLQGGDTMLLLWGAANRDPAEYERPDDVDLHRAVPRRHLAFGRGIHHCVGAPLARVEARTVIGMLLERTTSITLDPDQPARWANSLMVRRHDHLPLRLTPS
jgi:cytochrome P450